MSSHRRFQNIQLPERLRPTPERTSVNRTVREIRPCHDPKYSEVGVAVVYGREFIVATRDGRQWVIIKAQESVPATEGRCQ